MPESVSLAIIGGSGLYDLDALEERQPVELQTPFGKPSAPIMVGTLHGRRIAFLARHGVGHHLTPSEVPYRANIYALKLLGAERIVSVSACGSLREDLKPGDIVVPDQIFDHTSMRPRTFFGDGLVAHLSVPNPFCPDLSNQVETAVRLTGANVHRGGAFITIEGPRFSTKAESALYRNWGLSLIGMTTSPEAFLAREAEICYAVMAHITDYDVWHTSAAPVTVEVVVQILAKNAKTAGEAIGALARDLRATRDCDCEDAMAGALITQRAAIPASTRKKLGPLVKKYLPD